MTKIWQILKEPKFYVLIAPFLLFVIPLLQGRGVFWGLPALQFIPWRNYAWDLLVKGIMPLWNPLNGMGAPLLANYQLALFYPPAFPLFLLDEISGVSGLAWGFTFLIPVHLAWGALGISKFLREIGAGPRGQLVAGLAFGLSGYLVARGSFYSIIWAAVWLPWLLWGVERSLHAHGRRDSVKAFLAITIILAMQLLAGHAQVTWYSILFAGLWTFFRTVQLRGEVSIFRRLGLFLCCGVFAGLLTAVQLLPTFEYLQESQRATAYDFSQAMVYSFSPLRLTGYLVPELFGNPGWGDFWGYASYWEDAVYIGLAPFGLALTTLGWIFQKRGQRQPIKATATFFWVTSLIGILFALGSNTPVFPWLFKHVPTFDMFQAPARWMLWPTIAMAALAGLAADKWQANNQKTKVILNLAAFAGIILAVSSLVAGRVMTGIEGGLFRGFVFFGITLAGTAFIARRIAAPGQNFIWSKVAVGWIIFDLLISHALLNPTIPVKTFAGENKNLAVLNAVRDNARAWFDPESEYDIQYSSFFIFSDFTNRADWTDLRSSLLPNLNLLDTFSMANNFDPLQPARYSEWVAEVKQGDNESRVRWLSWAAVGAVIRSGDGDENLLAFDPIKARPRFEWTGCGIKAESGEAAHKNVSARVVSGEETPCIVVEGNITEGEINSVGLNGLVELESESPNRIVLSSISRTDGWILIRDTWYPGWKVKIDGISTQLYRAEYLFKAVPVSAGNHRIELEYAPDLYYFGLTISVIAWLIFCVTWIVVQRRNPRGNAPNA